MSNKDAPEKLKRKAYDKELRKLQEELCHLQDWIKASGERVIVVLEGRDAAGKGGTIKAITERVSPRVFRVVALPAPSDREKSQMYLQRYVERFPAGGEIVIFDRSWYNRAGVERVMGFCTDEQYETFLSNCPAFEKYIVNGGILLLKFWLEVSDEEQARRFEARIDDPLRQWKLSPMDLPSRKLWYQYSRARDLMLKSTDTKHAPWYILRSDDKRTARLNAIEHLLSMHPAAPDARRRAENAGQSLPAMLADLAAQAADSLSGAVLLAKGLHVVPEFLGNRAPLADPQARAVIAGLGMDNDLDSLVALYVAGICGIGYGLRQIIEAQAVAGAPIERVVISGGAGRRDFVRQLLADATGKPVLATQAEEPVMLGAAMLGGVAGGLFDDVPSAMAGMSKISRTYEPGAGAIAALHEARFRAFKQLQSLAREIR